MLDPAPFIITVLLTYAYHNLLLMLLVIVIDYARVDLKCDFALLVVFVEEAVNQRQHKFLHILLLDLPLQTLLHKLILVPPFNIHQHISKQQGSDQDIDKAQLLSHWYLLNVVDQGTTASHPKQDPLHQVLKVEVLVLVGMHAEQPVEENVPSPQPRHQDLIDELQP